MIPRYSPQDVAELFSDEHRFDTMLEVELLAAEASRARRCPPRSDASAMRQRRPRHRRRLRGEVEERER
jgi:adenylosuccinate lyase